MPGRDRGRGRGGRNRRKRADEPGQGERPDESRATERGEERAHSRRPDTEVRAGGHRETDGVEADAREPAPKRDAMRSGDFLPLPDEEPAEQMPSGSGLSGEGDRPVEVAGYWVLVWRKFRKHKLAVLGGVVTLAIYLVAAFAEFLAPFSAVETNSRYTYAPPQPLRFLTRTEEGIRLGMYVNGYDVEIDREAFRRTFVVNPEVVIPVGLFVKGSPYELFGLIPWDRHLIGPVDPSQPMFLLGADRLGRDVLSRTIHGAKVSMSIGLVGVFLSLILGMALGGASGYFGGFVDNAIQRVVEFLRSIPTIPLWMGLAAAIPLQWPPLRVYFVITVLLSLIGWTGLAREVRGRFFALKTEDFVTAARLDGVSESRIIMRHMMPSFSSHIIASVTLAIPAMILAETALSFLGIGLRSPVVSWGVLLQEAQNVRSVATAPWLFWPGVAVVIAVLSLNFLGDGLRDAADPYST